MVKGAYACAVKVAGQLPQPARRPGGLYAAWSSSHGSSPGISSGAKPAQVARIRGRRTGVAIGGAGACDRMAGHGGAERGREAVAGGLLVQQKCRAAAGGRQRTCAGLHRKQLCYASAHGTAQV